MSRQPLIHPTLPRGAVATVRVVVRAMIRATLLATFPGTVGAAALMAALMGSLFPGPSLGAQIIPVKTIPLATGDQFLVLPSEGMGMGGVSLAIDDPVLDPFVNPAKAGRIRESLLVGSPTYYTVSGNNGSGRTLPVAVLASFGGMWSGGVSLAIQEIRGPEPRTWGWPVWQGAGFIDPQPGVIWSPPTPPSTLLSERSRPNLYLSGTLARRLADGWSVGVGLSRAEIDAVDGVEHLFPGARSVDQDAVMTDYRMGVVREGERSTLEAVLVHRRFDGVYRAEHLQWAFPEDPDACVPGEPCGRWEVQTESNPDRTHTTAMHLGWVRRLDDSPWSLGTILTLNYKDHPKIPDYDLMNIPRDPGTTWAWNLGLGLGRSDEEGAYGVDLIFEPIRTETWAVSDEIIMVPSGSTLRPGDRSVENDFDFGNVRLRMGASRRVGPVRADLGLAIHSISYDLVQRDRILETTRFQEEHWFEWTPSWGAWVDLGGVEVSYQGRLVTGTGRPGTTTAVAPGLWAMTVDQAAGVDFVPAPSGPLTLDDAQVWSHRINVRIPLS